MPNCEEKEDSYISLTCFEVLCFITVWDALVLLINKVFTTLLPSCNLDRLRF